MSECSQCKNVRNHTNHLDKTSSRSLELLSAEHSHNASALDKGFSGSFSLASVVGPMLPSIAINLPVDRIKTTIRIRIIIKTRIIRRSRRMLIKRITRKRRRIKIKAWNMTKTKSYTNRIA